jgi:Flp pilus assembly protein TadG
MSAPPNLIRFLRCERGAAAGEFALICLLFVGGMLAIIDMARLAWELNSAKSATRVGARYATVHTTVSGFLANYDGAAAAGGNGVPVPEAAIPNPIVCTSSGCTGEPVAAPANTAEFNAIVNAMHSYYGRVTAANVVVEYRHVGLGMSGNPCAPDAEPLITVRLTGLPFQSSVLRIFGVAAFNVPEAATTLSAESMGQTSLCS